jgi:glycosyltransferase 2 family protein
VIDGVPALSLDVAWDRGGGYGLREPGAEEGERTNGMGISANDSAPSSDPDPRDAKNVRRRWIAVLKAALGVLVVWAVGRHVVRTWYDLHSQGREVRIDVAWMGVALVLYIAGLSAFGVFFWRIMKVSPTPVAMAPALRAYLISHLGKYVPGKAMVVLMRVGLVVPYGARPATAAFATLYETLVMMSAGGLLAAAGFAVRRLPPLPIALGAGFVVPAPLVALSLSLGLGFLLLTWPRVFPRLSAWISVPFPGVGPDALPRISLALLAFGLFCSWAGWVLLGLSQVAVVRALSSSGLASNQWPLVVASVALATVAGFVVAILPGGFGVRELVIMTTLAPAVGVDLAVIAAIALRLDWVIGEVLIAAALWILRPPLPRRAEP